LSAAIGEFSFLNICLETGDFIGLCLVVFGSALEQAKACPHLLKIYQIFKFKSTICNFATRSIFLKQHTNEFAKIYIRFHVGVCKPAWKHFDVSVFLPSRTDSMKPPGSCQTLRRALFSVHQLLPYLIHIFRNRIERINLKFCEFHGVLNPYGDNCMMKKEMK